MDITIQEKRNKQVKRLQQSLSSIRKIAGWTAEELGDRIGVTKQTISNLENNKTEMSFTQYIAIRAVLDCEIADNPENELLPQVIRILLDQDEADISAEEYEKLKSSVDTVAAAAAGGASDEALKTTFSSLVTPILIGAGVGILAPLGLSLAIGSFVGGAWLKNYLTKSKKNQKKDDSQTIIPETKIKQLPDNGQTPDAAMTGIEQWENDNMSETREQETDGDAV